VLGIKPTQSKESAEVKPPDDLSNEVERLGVRFKLSSPVNHGVVIDAVLHKSVGAVSVVCKVYYGDYKAVYDVLVKHANCYTRYVWSRRYSDLRLAAKADHAFFGDFPSRSLFSNHSLDFLNERTQLLA